MAIEYDMNELIGGTVESISAKLGELSDAQLTALDGLEREAAKPRQSLLDAIAAEIGSRTKPQDGAADQGDAQAKAEAAAIDAQAKRIAELENQAAADAKRIAELETAAVAADAEIKRLTALKAPKDAKVKDPKATTLKVAALGNDVPAEVRVICVDGDDATIIGLPAMLFSGWQFSVEKQDDRASLVLNEGISFPPSAPDCVVSAIYASADGKTGMRATLVQPLVLGGGKSVELPAGHLRFDA